MCRCAMSFSLPHSYAGIRICILSHTHKHRGANSPIHAYVNAVRRLSQSPRTRVRRVISLSPSLVSVASRAAGLVAVEQQYQPLLRVAGVVRVLVCVCQCRCCVVCRTLLIVVFAAGGSCCCSTCNGRREHMGALTPGAQFYLIVCVVCEWANMSLGFLQAVFLSSSFISFSLHGIIIADRRPLGAGKRARRLLLSLGTSTEETSCISTGACSQASRVLSPSRNFRAKSQKNSTRASVALQLKNCSSFNIQSSLLV